MPFARRIFNCNKDTVLTLANLCATSVLLVGLATYVYLPFTQDSNSAREATRGQSGTHFDEALALDEGNDHLTFSVVFYLGLSAGSILGGVTSTLISPEKSASFFSRFCCLVSLIAARAMDNSSDNLCVSDYKWEWFCLSSSAIAAYLSTYVHTLQSVPGTWTLWVSLGLLGAHWPIASFFSIILATKLDTWHDRMFFQGIMMLVGTTLRDLTSMPANNDQSSKGKKETLLELCNNSLGLRYLAYLSFLWVIHGYMYYGSYHEIYRDETAMSQSFRCIVAFVFKLLFATLCYWTGQQRPVMAVLLFLNALAMFALTTFHSVGRYDDQHYEIVISITIQIISFLVSCSWCILWALTVRTFGLGIRCLATGLCCSLARLSSLVGSVAVAHDMYRAYPSAISGFLSLTAALVIFLLPEPNATCLTSNTKRPKHDGKGINFPDTNV